MDIKEYVQAEAKTMADGGIMGSILGYNVPIVNASCLQGVVLEEMLKADPRHSFVVCYHDQIDGRHYYLLSDGRVDVGVLARSVGGEGSRKTAKFVIREIGMSHLIVDGPRLLLSDVEHE